MLLACASATAAAGTPDAPYGAPACRIGTLLPAPVDGDVTWSGACKDGFADGPGVLAWNDADDSRRRVEGTLARGSVVGTATLTFTVKKDARIRGKNRSSYEGTLRDGLPDGEGFFRFADGALYEGEVAAGERHGAGYHGLVRMRVLVGADGKAKSVTAIGKLPEQVVRLVGAAVMTPAYKPAVCQGTPCEMVYPVSFRIK